MGATTMETGAERKLTAFGVTKTIEEWAMDARAAVYPELILRRLDEGMTPEQAIARPVAALERGPVKLLAWGERKTFRDWADDPRCAVSPHNLRDRMKAGWTSEQAISLPVQTCLDTRLNDLVEAFGEAKSLREWEADERAAATAHEILRRMDAGWAAETAIGEPVKPRVNHKILAFGETKTLRAWSRDERCRANRNAIIKRIDEGMDPEEAITTPVREIHERGLTAFGETKTLEEWAKDPRCSVTETTLSQRRKLGMSPEEAITKPSSFVARPEEERIAGLPSHTRGISAFGERKSLSAWLRDPRCAVDSINAIRERIDAGWEAEAAITTPSLNVPLRVTAWGETKAAMDWARDPRCRVSSGCFYQRLKKGMEPETAMTQPTAEGWQDREFEAFGETRTLREWSEDARCSVSYDVLHSRITNYGMGLELALVAPTKGCKRGRYGEFVEAFGETKLLGEWMGDPRCAVSRKALGRRLRLGWELEKAMVTPERGDLQVNVQGKFVEAFGERKNRRQWAMDPRCRVDETVLNGRLARGWEAERAISTPPLAAGEVTIVREARGAELRMTAWGETRRIGAWAKDPRCVVRTATLRNRLDNGWTSEEAMATPAGGGRDERGARAAAWAIALERNGARALAVAFGEAKTVSEWAADPRARAWGEAISQRLAEGVPPEEAITLPADARVQAPRFLAWGERKTIVDWSDDPRAAVPTGTIRHRIESGWEPERAISTPHAEPSLRMMEAFGETRNMSAWQEDDRCVVSMWTVRKRLSEGWTLEAALATPGRESLEGGLTAWGETKTLAAWALDPRCEVGPANIGMRLKRGLSPEEAISRRSHLVKHGENAPEGTTLLSAWGDAKALSDWLADPRCAVGAATLRNRIADGVAPEVALSAPDASPWKDGVTAWGETKSIAGWARDPRCTVNPGQVAVRLGKGMSPEEAIGGPNRAAKAEPMREDERPKGVSKYATLVTAWGETKTPQEWSRDARCSVVAETIRRRIGEGMAPELAVSSPKETHETSVTAWGETKRVSEWLRDPRCVMTANGLHTRLAKGMAPEEAMTRPAPKRGETNLVEAFGERKTMQEWAADPRCRVTYTGLQKRLLKGGMSVEEAMTREAKPQNRDRFDVPAEAFGETKTVAEWIRDARAAVPEGSVRQRLNRGWPLEEALTLAEGAFLPGRDRRRLLTAWGETKTMKEWGADPRCKVAENTISYRIDRGWNLESALTEAPRRETVGRGAKRGLSKPHARESTGRAA